MRRAVVPACILLMLACASHHIPAELRGYAIVVEGRDEQSIELARALEDYGVRVRHKLRGGSGPTAALIHFTSGASGLRDPTLFHVRLADTRSGVVLRGGTVPLDSLTATPRSRATAAVRALMAEDSAFSSP